MPCFLESMPLFFEPKSTNQNLNVAVTKYDLDGIATVE